MESVTKVERIPPNFFIFLFCCSVASLQYSMDEKFPVLSY
jgi:uncharacterized membrane protein